MKRVYVLLGLMILFGAINTIVKKIASIQVTNQETAEMFNHPYIQTLLMFVAYIIVGLAYLLKKIWKQDKSPTTIQKENQKKPAPFYTAFWPTVFDMLAVIFSNLALNMVDTSVWQLSRGGAIITTAILSRIILKKILTTKAFYGCILAFIGVTSVQVVTVLSSSTGDSIAGSKEIVGLILLFISILFNSFGMIMDKKVYDKYEIDPLKMVFYQGIIGILLTGFIILGLQQIECPWSNKSHCVCLANNQCYMENFGKFFNDCFSNSLILTLTICYILTCAIFNPIGAILSKQVSPISRALANVGRALVIWVFNLGLTVAYADEYKEYELENRSLIVNVFKGIGFLLLMWGIILYHDQAPAKSDSNDKLKIK